MVYYTNTQLGNEKVLQAVVFFSEIRFFIVCRQKNSRFFKIETTRTTRSIYRVKSLF